MKPNLLSSIFVVLACLFIGSCHKSTGSPAGEPQLTGLYVMNMGPADPTIVENWSSSTLSFYNFSTRQVTPDLYSAVNGKALGYTANDMGIYGTKLYLAITNSSVINIVNPKTGKLIKQDSLYNPIGALPLVYYIKAPRNLAFYNGNVYISCNDGTIVVLDTLSLSVKSTIALPGTAAQLGVLGGLVAANNKLYVTAPGVGVDVTNTVYVFDLATNQFVKKINVIPYPVNIAADNYGNVYVESSYTDDWQMYDISLGGMTIIDSKTDLAKSSFMANTATAQGVVTVSGDLVYYCLDGKIAVYNAKTQTPVSSNFVTDGTVIQYLTSICANPVTGEVYVADAGSYTSPKEVVDIFDKTGKLESSFPTGIGPVKIQLVN